jgi:hypothetical protein
MYVNMDRKFRTNIWTTTIVVVMILIGMPLINGQACDAGDEQCVNVADQDGQMCPVDTYRVQKTCSSGGVW